MTRGLFDLSGKVVLATGANSGIGLGFLQGCAKHGADVVVWGRRADKNGQSGDDSRMQFTFKYSFSSKDFFH